MAEDTRRRLLDAARELFWKSGYYASSVSEILERGEANSGSLYHFFPTKQDLLLAVLEGYAENLETEIVELARRRAKDPVERVFAILDAYREALLATDLTYGCPIGSLALEFREPAPAVREGLSRNFTGWCEAVETCLEGARERFPPDLDLAEVSRFVLSVMEGGVMQARTHRSIEPFDASVRHLRGYLEGLVEPAA